MGASREDPVEAGLLGAWPDGSEFVLRPNRDQPIGGALGRFGFAAFELKAAEGNRGFEGVE